MVMMNNYNEIECLVSMLKTKSFKFFAKINLDEVTMTYVGLYATFERSMTQVSAGV